jgi:DNA-binding Lrp family transcriptional regulator
VESIAVDRIDRCLIHALKVDGRASFRAIGEVLGVSDQTVARRYQRLRADDAVRVVGVPGMAALGQDEWHVRIRCMPDAALPVAEALARRTDTYWIQITAGGSEILCVTRPESLASHEALLLAKLPRTPRITEVIAHQLLRSFEPDPALFGVRLGGLDAAATDRLRPPPEDGPPMRMDDTDRILLSVLSHDGRTGYPELAAATGSSETTVRRRLNLLRRSGSLRFDIDIDNRMIGQQAQILLWLAVLPSALTATAEALRTFPEVNFIAVVTGPSNVLASVTCADGGALYDFLTQRIGALGAVRRVESAPVLRVVKRHGQPARR